MTTTQPRAGRLEVRSIDYVPLNERHGKVWHLGPLWFMSQRADRHAGGRPDRHQ